MNKDSNSGLRKLIMTAIFIALSFTLSTFVVFPNMAPFQHFMNVLGAAFLGPFYNTLAALVTGGLRMMMGRPILAITGGVVGAFLSGLLYKFTEKELWAFAGESVGTGIISALISYPIMKYIYGLDLGKFYYYIPFFLPSALVGALMGVLVLNRLKKFHIVDKYRIK